MDLRFRCVRTGDEVRVIDADLELHRSVCSLADSQLTLEMWELLVQRFRGARLSLLREYRDDLATVVSSHEPLVEALESSDAERAQTAFRDHLTCALATWAARSPILTGRLSPPSATAPSRCSGSTR